MPAVIPSLSVPLSAVRAQPGHAVVSATHGTEAPPGPQATAPAAVPLEVPVWPGPGTVDLLTKLLDLGETQITYTATITLPETGADFWDMLTAALPMDE